MAATSPSDPSPESAPRLRRYVAIGDSFTAGMPEDPEGEGRWPDAFAIALRERHPELEYHNLAVSGVTSADVAGEQLERAVALGPDLVTAVCGGNDVLLTVRPDIDGYAETFEGILARLRPVVRGPYLLTATTPDFSPWLEMGERSRRRVSEGIAAVNDATRAVAARHDVLCLDLALRDETAERETFSADGMHASAVANRWVAETFIAAVAELEERHPTETRPEEGR